MLRIAVALAVLALPLGFVLSGAESREWISHPRYGVDAPIWSAVFRRAALGAFSVPYVILAVMAAVRARGTARLTQVLGWGGVVVYAALLLTPTGNGLPYIVRLVGDVPAVIFYRPKGAPFLVAQVALILLLFWLQRRLIWDGLALDKAGAWGVRKSKRRTMEFVAAVVFYVLVWVASLYAPDAMERANVRKLWRTHEAAAAAEKSRIPVGAPLLLAWEVDVLPGQAQRDLNVPVRTSVDADGAIYVAFAEGIAALETSGRVRWRNDTVRPEFSKLVSGRDSLVFVGGANGLLYALRAADGAIAWHVPEVPDIKSGVALHDPAVGSDGAVYAGVAARERGVAAPLERRAPDGRLLWQLDLARGVSAPVLVGPGDTVYAIGDVGDFRSRDTLYAVSPQGVVVWRTPLSTRYAKAIEMLPDGTLGLNGRDELAFFARDGQLLGKQRPEIAVVPVADTIVLLVRSDRVALATPARAADSSRARWVERWHYDAARISRGESLSDAVVMPGGRAVISTSSRVVVLRLADGHPVAEYVPSERTGRDGARRQGLWHLSAPAVGPDGTIYVADTDHHVYALRDTLRQ